MYGEQYQRSNSVGSHRLRIALRERVFGFGQRAHQQAPILPGFSGKLLRDFEGGENRVILLSAGRDDPRNRELRSRLARADLEGLAGMNAGATREVHAHNCLSGVICKPASFDLPSGISRGHAGGENASAVRDGNVVAIPGSNQGRL